MSLIAAIVGDVLLHSGPIAFFRGRVMIVTKATQCWSPIKSSPAASRLAGPLGKKSRRLIFIQVRFIPLRFLASQLGTCVINYIAVVQKIIQTGWYYSVTIVCLRVAQRCSCAGGYNTIE